MCDKKVGFQAVNWNSLGDTLIYGLLYPAYFGNMVYDLIRIFLKLWAGESTLDEQTISWLTLITGIAIVLFFVVDFIHLYVYMNKMIPINSRSRRYMWCDVITPHIFFLGFILAKNENHTLSIISLAAIPPFILLYKGKPAKGNWIYSDKKKRFCNLGLVAFFDVAYLSVAAFYLVTNSWKADLNEEHFLCYFALAGLAYYFVYIIVYHFRFHKNEWEVYNPNKESNKPT